MRIYRHNALIFAVMDNEVDLINDTIKKGYNFEPEELLQLLVTCCDYDRENIASLFIPLSPTDCLTDASVYAARTGKTEILKLILGHKKDIANQRDSKALRYASKNGHFEAAKLLIENKADVNAVLGEALRHASWKGHFEIVKTLISSKADVTVNNGEALKRAKKGGFQNILSLINETIKSTALGESKKGGEEKV